MGGKSQAPQVWESHGYFSIVVTSGEACRWVWFSFEGRHGTHQGLVMEFYIVDIHFYGCQITSMEILDINVYIYKI